METLDERICALEIDHVAFSYSAEAAERRLAEAAAIHDRRSARPGGDWLAYVEGRAVSYGSATAGPRGLYLAGGGTLPEARGLGAYRALVRARWDYAVALGTPALVVHAQETSRPILERLGFGHVCAIHELEHRAR